VIFADGAGGDLIEEHVFRGPLPLQIRSALGFLESRGGTLVRKVPGRAEAEHDAAYPHEAVEEAIVNGVYHRGYDGPPEPLKVYLYPDRMEVTTYPGPVLGIEAEHFEPRASIPPLPARNRRIGELLKELRLAEGRGTGVPKIQRAMRANGSPVARFDFDAARTYFRVTLPLHPSHTPQRLAARAGEKPDAAALLRTLKARLAAGEISIEDYRQIKAEILPNSGD